MHSAKVLPQGNKHFLLIVEVIFLTLIFTGPHGYTQETYNPDLSLKKHQFVSAGYVYNLTDTKERENGTTKKHFASLLYSNLKAGGRHPVGYGYSAGTEVGLINTKNFTIAPTISGSLTIAMFRLGSELTYYTDFSGYSFNYSPTLGFGYEGMSLHVKPNIKLSGYQFNHLNNGSVVLLFPFYHRTSKKTGFIEFPVFE